MRGATVDRPDLDQAIRFCGHDDSSVRCLRDVHEIRSVGGERSDLTGFHVHGEGRSGLLLVCARDVNELTAVTAQ